jgi:hypothetical protein
VLVAAQIREHRRDRHGTWPNGVVAAAIRAT